MRPMERVDLYELPSTTLIMTDNEQARVIV